MEDLKQSVNKLVKEILTVEDPRLIKKECETSVEMEQEKNSPAKSQDIFQDNKVANRQKIKYTTTIIKSRNFLSNIPYIGISKEDYYNKNFILEVYLLLTKNLNRFSLDRKLADKTKHEMIYMLWRECMPVEFYKYICEEKKLYLFKWKECPPANCFADNS